MESNEIKETIFRCLDIEFGLEELRDTWCISKEEMTLLIINVLVCHYLEEDDSNEEDESNQI